jgi:hypothetical protein
MPKERTDGSPQLNLRVPREHHDRVRSVVALLRTAEGFPPRLDELLAAASESLTPSLQAGIMARLERLEVAVFAPTEVVKPPLARAAIAAIIDGSQLDSGDSGDRKKGTALPADIKAQVRHLIETEPEMSNAAIGEAVGVSYETVRRIRRGRR